MPPGDGSAAEELFARFLEQHEGDSPPEFEDLLRQHPEHSGELIRLHGAWQMMQGALSGDTSALGSGGDAMPAPGSIEFGLAIENELGRGACGRVYRARDRVLERTVALKVIDPTTGTPDLRARFLEEARILAKLEHPNIVRIHAIDEEAGLIRLALEYIEGRTLHELVDEDGPMSSSEAALVGIDLCRGLAALHSAGLVHMDLKPGNVMRAAGGRVVLLDFGFARDPSASDAKIGGTPPFMSPEHFTGSNLSPTTDLFGLGATLYWLVAGREPYDYQGIGDLAVKVVDGQRVPLVDACPSVDPAFAAVLEKAMAIDPKDRYQSAGEMEAALRRVVGESEVIAEPVKTSKWPVVAAAAAVIVSLATLFFANRPAAASELELEARFFKLVGEEGVPLEEDDAVALGDRIYLEVEGSEPFYLYVFNEDKRGNWYRLEPKTVPILHEANVVHRRPEATWQVNSVGGRELLFVVASTERVPFAEALLEVVPPVGSGTDVSPRSLDQQQIASLRGTLRGIGGEGKETSTPGERPSWTLEEYFQRFEAQLTEDARIEFQRLNLANP